MRQGVDDAPGWQEHYCVHVNRQHCSRLGTSETLGWQHRCSTVLLRASNAHLLVCQSQRKTRSSEKHQSTTCAQHSVLRNQEHTIYKTCHKAQKKWRMVTLLMCITLTGLSGTHTQAQVSEAFLSTSINVSGTQSLSALNFCQVQKHPNHLKFPCMHILPLRINITSGFARDWKPLSFL